MTTTPNDLTTEQQQRVARHLAQERMFAMYSESMTAWRKSQGRMTVERTGDRDRDASALMQALTSEIESAVRRYPEQYMWGHRRWRTPRAATP